MNLRERTNEQLLEALNSTVIDAAAFLAAASPVLSDGRQTSHGILAQMVFWHERHVEVARALVSGAELSLIGGTVDALNDAARHRYAREPMADLGHNLSVLQAELDSLLRQLPDWSINFPLKRDSGFCNVDERVVLLEENVRNRLNQMKRAARH